MLRLYNTLSKQIEDFIPQEDKIVRLYACGPTVYDYAHIGNFRTYVTTDILVRTLKYFGYKVNFVMNVTDVGHLTSDSDTGEDKLEKGARREGKTAWDIANFYTDAFLGDSKKLNLTEPDVRPKPTEHIAEQINMVQKLLDKGFAYRIDDGIYFDTSKFPHYGELTGQKREELQEGARVEVNPQKRNPTDFALWKLSPHPSADGKKRDMEWPSPWGVGFPGWHIECSAMSMRYLDDQLDIHTGGVDLIPIHHTNEIAQSEASSGKSPFSKYWVHGQFIMVDNEKMSKSKGNFYRLADIEKKGFEPLALRYLYLTSHYRAFLNFTWEALANAQQSLLQLHSQISNLKSQISKRNTLSEEKLTKVNTFRTEFEAALENDLNMPQALAIVWKVLKSNIPPEDKQDLIFSFDEVLGLDIKKVPQSTSSKIPEEVTHLAQARQQLRKAKEFQEADKVRIKIEELGYAIEDTARGVKVKKK